MAIMGDGGRVPWSPSTEMKDGWFMRDEVTRNVKISAFGTYPWVKGRSPKWIFCGGTSTEGAFGDPRGVCFLGELKEWGSQGV